MDYFSVDTVFIQYPYILNRKKFLAYNIVLFICDIFILLGSEAFYRSVIEGPRKAVWKKLCHGVNTYRKY